jgi:hypothetical protein
MTSNRNREIRTDLLTYCLPLTGFDPAILAKTVVVVPSTISMRKRNGDTK